MTRLAMIAAIIMALFPNQVSAQVNAVLPVTCNPNSPGDCVKSTPVVNPDGTAVGSGGGVPTGSAGSPNANVVSVQGVPNGTPQNVSQQDATGSGSLALATANAVYTIPLGAGRNAVGLTINGLTGSGATITAERSNDGGTTWTNANTTESSATSSLSATITANGQARVGVAGATNIRLRVSTVGTGTATISYVASTAAGPVFLTSALPSYSAPDGRIIGGVDNRFINGIAISSGAGAADTGTQRLAVAAGASLATGQISVGTTATLVRAADAGRTSITVIVGSATACAFGNAGVTLTTGYLLPATAGATDTTATSAALYGVCSAAATVSYKAILP